VVGTRSTVFNDVPAELVAFGQPAQPMRKRRNY
jgi:acetyltransferase-like isoleucine patch superfamily enzyme